jgi:hypothetical protein
LRKANLVHVRTDGQQRLYSLDPIGISELGRWIAHLESLSTERLTALEDGLRSERSPTSASAKKRSSKKRRRKS